MRKYSLSILRWFELGLRNSGTGLNVNNELKLSSSYCAVYYLSRIYTVLVVIIFKTWDLYLFCFAVYESSINRLEMDKVYFRIFLSFLSNILGSGSSLWWWPGLGQQSSHRGSGPSVTRPWASPWRSPSSPRPLIKANILNEKKIKN